MRISTVLSLERMLVGAGLREFGIPPWLAIAVVGFVALFDVRVAVAAHEFILAEPVRTSFLLVLASLVFGSLALSFLVAPHVRISPPTSPAEDVVHSLAGLDASSALAAAFLRRARSLAVPCTVLLAAAAFTPLDVSVALGVIVLLFAGTLGGAATAALLLNATGRTTIRIVAVATCIFTAALTTWLAHTTTGYIGLAAIPIFGAALSSVLVTAALTLTRTKIAERQPRIVTAFKCRLPSLGGGYAPVALVVAQARARPLSMAPWLCFAAGALFAAHWACTNASSPTVADQITLIGACFPAALSAVDAASTTRNLAHPLWWLQARHVPAAVRDTVVATSLAQFGLCAIIVATAALSGASLSSAAAGLILGIGVITIARCVATIARRRIRRLGVVGGSGLLELLEALIAAPFAMLPVLILFISPSSWWLPISLIAPIGAFWATSALSRSVCALGPGRLGT
jgi:hypothetical protein